MGGDAVMKDADKEEEIVGKKGLSEIGGSKTKEDFTPLLESSIPQNRDLALKQGKKAQAIENLLGVSLPLLLFCSLKGTAPHCPCPPLRCDGRRFVLPCFVGPPSPRRFFGGERGCVAEPEVGGEQRILRWYLSSCKAVWLQQTKTTG